MTDKVLWASDIFSLNDASEVDYAMQVAGDVLKKYPAVRPIADRIVDGKLPEVYRSWQTHVCCFSSEEDSLSQWRAYGAGGYGFAIGFHAGLLFQSMVEKAMIVPILYSENRQREKLEAFSVAVSALLDAATVMPENDLFVEVAHAIIALMAPIKNPKFSDEREWRILHVKAKAEPGGTFFRPIHGAIVPYTKLPVDAKCFSRVIQGPTLHREFGERSLKIFLNNNALEHVKVESSVIPLRSL